MLRHERASQCLAGADWPACSGHAWRCPCTASPHAHRLAGFIELRYWLRLPKRVLGLALGARWRGACCQSCQLLLHARDQRGARCRAGLLTTRCADGHNVIGIAHWHHPARRSQTTEPQHGDDRGELHRRRVRALKHSYCEIRTSS